MIIYQHASKIIDHVIFGALLEAYRTVFCAWTRPLLKPVWKLFQMCLRNNQAIERQLNSGWLSTSSYEHFPPRRLHHFFPFLLSLMLPHPRFLIPLQDLKSLRESHYFRAIPDSITCGFCYIRRWGWQNTFHVKSKGRLVGEVEIVFERI